MKILVNNKFVKHELPLLSEADVLKQINEYLEELGLSDYVDI